MSPIEKAVAIAGSQKELARLLGVTPGFVSHMVTKRSPVPATLCRRIERAVGGEVTRENLRPDVFGSASA